MSYIQRTFPNAEYEFPEPPKWLVWYETYAWRQGGYQSTGQGQVRHYYDLQKAKKSISPGNYNGGRFTHDWAIYQWDGNRYVRHFSGKSGDHKDQNPLFQMRVRKDDKGRDVVVDENEVEQALASIREAVK
jgi:hypothetical protein